jgi:hypothetical protein
MVVPCRDRGGQTIGIDAADWASSRALRLLKQVAVAEPSPDQDRKGFDRTQPITPQEMAIADQPGGRFPIGGVTAKRARI